MKVTAIERTNSIFIDPPFVSHVKWVTEDGRIFHQGVYGDDAYAVFEAVDGQLTHVSARSLLYAELDAAGKYYHTHMYDVLKPTQ